MTGTHYTGLIVWQKAVDLVEAVYKATATFPKEELFGLTSQVRRAAVSVPSNIAEGQGRASMAEFRHHLSIAHWSLCELETQVVIATRLGYLPESERGQLTALASEVGKLLNGLAHRLAAG